MPLVPDAHSDTAPSKSPFKPLPSARRLKLEFEPDVIFKIAGGMAVCIAASTLFFIFWNNGSDWTGALLAVGGLAIAAGTAKRAERAEAVIDELRQVEVDA